MSAAKEDIGPANQLKADGVKLKIMVVVPHYWGKGDTIDEAWKRVKRESCKTVPSMKKGPHTVYVCFDKTDGSASTRLDSFGMNISYPQGYPPVIIGKKDA